MNVSRTGLCLVATIALPCVAAQPANFKAGVAAVDITPQEPIRQAGYASRNKPSDGVALPLFCKAIALEDAAGRRVVIVTADILGYVRALVEPVAKRAADELGLARDQIVFFASHTHAGPVIRTQQFDMYALPDDQLQVVTAYTHRLAELTFQAIRGAVTDLKPARLAYGVGRAGFAMNRRQFTPTGVRLGVDRDGPVDHDVPVLFVTTPEGTPRAIVFGYACHCTTMGGNFYKICSEYAGYAQTFLEQVYPDATALFVTGCGGDANPHPRGTLAMARQHGLELAGGVTGAISNRLKPVVGPLHTALEYVDVPLAEPPPREEWERRLKDGNVYIRRNAKRQLAVLDREGKIPATYPYPVQTIQLGRRVTLIALAGEVVVDYSIRLKRELGRGRTWVAGYANDVFAYIPTARLLYEGGYEADYSMIYYGMPGPWDKRIEGIIVDAAHRLTAKVRSAKP